MTRKKILIWDNLDRTCHTGIEGCVSFGDSLTKMEVKLVIVVMIIIIIITIIIILMIIMIIIIIIVIVEVKDEVMSSREVLLTESHW